MKPKRIFWRLYASYVLVTLLALAAIAWVASQSIRHFYLKRVSEDLESRAALVRDYVAEKLRTQQETQVDSLCKRLGQLSGTRITVIDVSGRVIGESQEDPALMDDHSNRPEVRVALGGRIGVSERYSATLRRNMMYVALPLRHVVVGRRQVIAVVRAAVPVAFINQALQSIYWKIALAGLVSAAVFAGISIGLSRRISGPLQELRRGAEEFSRGRFQRRLSVPALAELGALAEAMNDMASQLHEKIETITRQRNEQEAVLRSMVEGVLAVDASECVVSVNRAGARMLNVDPVTARGRSIQEVVRNPDIQALVQEALGKNTLTQGDIVLHGEEARYLHANGAPLHDAQGSQIGAVVVLNDVTQLRRLERIRRDFVANVSHELKSPITSVKSAAETLLDGTASGRDDIERFLHIIGRQADRMSAIIEDLLSLSRVEAEEPTAVALEEADIEPVLRTAVQACQDKAVARGMEVAIECAPGLKARIDRELLERAVTNLVDNALTYSEPGKAVRVSAAAEDSGAVISVADQGYGIERKHLPRVFERFYRVDRNRSRELGGTGLGLAIVKHVAEAHGGGVSAESTPGEGSTFSIHLPTG